MFKNKDHNNASLWKLNNWRVGYSSQCVEQWTCMIVVKASSKGPGSHHARGKNIELYTTHHSLYIKMDEKWAAVCDMCYSCLHKVLHSPQGDKTVYICK